MLFIQHLGFSAFFNQPSRFLGQLQRIMAHPHKTAHENLKG
jgi:hypothetical protein